jgi:hypothetical protein
MKASPTRNFDLCKKYAEEMLCWLDGVKTHASNLHQRQCPKCRTKWSYVRILQKLLLLEEYCNGENVSCAALKHKCSRNTVTAAFCGFNASMEETIGQMLLDGSIATNPQNCGELKSLEKALNTGKKHLRTRSCKHLFMNSLSYPERVEIIFREKIANPLDEAIESAEFRRNLRYGLVRMSVPRSVPSSGSSADRLDKKTIKALVKAKMLQQLRLKYPHLPEKALDFGEFWIQVMQKIQSFMSR